MFTAHQMMIDDSIVGPAEVIVPEGLPLKYLTNHPHVAWFREDPITRVRVPHGKLRYLTGVRSISEFSSDDDDAAAAAEITNTATVTVTAQNTISPH